MIKIIGNIYLLKKLVTINFVYFLINFIIFIMKLNLNLKILFLKIY